MLTAVLAFFVMLLIVSGMAIGVIAGRKPIAGSCGGLNAMGVDTECEICGGNPALCESASDTQGRGESLNYALAKDVSNTEAQPARDPRQM